jgi:hypothetical protein
MMPDGMLPELIGLQPMKKVGSIMPNTNQNEQTIQRGAKTKSSSRRTIKILV